MAKVSHLSSDCSTDEIIEVIERDGTVIIDDLVSPAWLAEFNAAVQTSIDDYKPYDYGDPDSIEFLGRETQSSLDPVS